MFRNLFNFLEYGSKIVGSRKSEVGSRQLMIVSFFLHFTFCILHFTLTNAQKPIGRFMADSIEIGKPIRYVLSYRHSPAAEVFFPDTTYNFYPFELLNRSYLPTETTNKGSLDSVIYTLETFEITPIQRLSLPIYSLSQKDCTTVFSQPDSVFLKEMIKGNLGNLGLKSDLKLIPLQPQIDYLRVVGYLLGILVGVMVIYGFFGRFIRKQYRLFRFGQRHREFLLNYKRHTRGTFNSNNIGKALVLWKKHLEWLEKKPYSSYTTKEIINQLPNERLEEALRDVDSAIYGGIISTQMPFAMNILQETATERYQERRSELSVIL
jgi:hypothetical protein